jgi:nucleotidyltransferase substrate binding protein (TIGR01987 family)
MAALDISSLGSAIMQLRTGLATLSSDPADLLYRDGVIQRFEFTYGLCHKMLLRSLEQASPAQEEIAEMSFAALVRTGSEFGLLRSGWENWQRFREARNITSHTYDQAKAAQVLSVVPDFLGEAEFLYEQLQQRIG